MALIFFSSMISGLDVCSNDKEACISDVLCYQEGGNVRIWNLRFHRDFHERELEDA